MTRSADPTSLGPPRLPRSPRSDAGRNRQALVDAASELFGRDGAGASLEAVGRRAGVGSATLHRHFPGRRALLAAVYADHVTALAERAEVVARDADPGAALSTWLFDVAHHCVDNLAILQLIQAESGPGEADPSWQTLLAAGEPLLRLGVEAGTVDPQTRLDDLLVLVNAVVGASGSDRPRVDRTIGRAFTGLAGPLPSDPGSHPGSQPGPHPGT